MASIAAAAMKESMDRRLSDQVRLRTGFMLTFEDLAHREGVAEKHVLHRVLERRIVSNTQLMALPLSLAYFLFYVVAYYMHEDISNVFYLESTIRTRTDDMFQTVETIDSLWESLEGKFMKTFFIQSNATGGPLQKSDVIPGDQWGLWGRVETYNQIQGPVRIASTRTGGFPSKTKKCFSNNTCSFCNNPATAKKDGLTGPCIDTSGRRLEERRLELYRPELEGTMQEGIVEGDSYKFFLYPADDIATISETLQYYKLNDWIDNSTSYLEISFYLMNCELGRCRLEQVSLSFRFSDGGGIYYGRRLIPIFLETFAGWRNMLADGCFFMVWGFTSIFRGMLAWRAFVQSELFAHLWNILNLFEFFVVLSGTAVIGVVGFFFIVQKECRDILQKVRGDTGWMLTINDPRQDAVDEMFERIPYLADFLENFRMVGNFFALLLMFRFFINFGAQPRLRVVTRTLAVVTNDLCHFGLVFIPIIAAYMVSGTIMFGRNFSTFTTVKAALGSSFRIMMEAEYDWQDWTQEFYWYTGLWAWSFMFMVVLLMLNMVLAIILDVYNEVRIKTGAKDAEPMWTTVYNCCMWVWHCRRWVSGRKLLRTLNKAHHIHGSVITESDMRHMFPGIPDVQVKILFTDCRREMKAHSTRDLDNRSLLQAAGSLMQNLDKANTVLKRLNHEEASDPIHTWTTPITKKTPAASVAVQGHDTFMTVLSSSKGTKHPHILDPDEPVPVNDDDAFAQDTDDLRPPASEPSWLKDVNELLASQRQWLKHAQWQLQQMEWQIQLGHASRYETATDHEPPAL